MSPAIDLDSGVAECGEEVTGVVSGLADRATVELAWRTTGRGATDSDVAASTTAEPGGDGRARFRLAIPAEGPMSIEGTLVHVVWEVRVADASAPLVVLPRGGLAMWVRQAGAPPDA